MLLNVEKTIFILCKVTSFKNFAFYVFYYHYLYMGPDLKKASFVSLPGVCIDLPQTCYLQVASPIPLLHRHR